MVSRLRRRRRARGLPAGLAALVLIGVAGALLLWQAGGTRDDPGSSSPLPAARPPAAEAAPPAAPPALSPAAVALGSPDAFRLRFRTPPRAAVVFDMDSGRVLWRRHPRARLPIASLTKIMTALLVVERTTSRDRVKITRAALAYRGQAVGLLPPGRRVPIEALLHGMLLTSGNDAAIALADHVGGSERRFVRMMNLRARRLGLRCTKFVSSHGLEPGNRSCAADVAALTRLAMDERRIARVVRKPQAALRFPIRGGRLFLNSTNPLVRGRYPGAVGLKTGYTDAAGRCLAGVARRGSRRLAVVLLHSPDPSRQSRKLLTSGFRAG